VVAYHEEDQNHTIPFTNISDYFEFSFDPLLSHGDCDSTDGYRLCSNEDCSILWEYPERAELVFYTELTVQYVYLHQKNIMYEESPLFLQKFTRGQVTSS